MSLLDEEDLVGMIPDLIEVNTNSTGCAIKPLINPKKPITLETPRPTAIPVPFHCSHPSSMTHWQMVVFTKDALPCSFKAQKKVDFSSAVKSTPSISHAINIMAT